MNRIYCFGFLVFSKSIIRRFFSTENATLIFVRSAHGAIKKKFDKEAHIASWGKRGESQAALLASQFGMDIWRVEDGFIRSTGLGSDYSPAASLVIDKSGIYYDPSRPSDLETLLQTFDFTNDILDRANKIQQSLVGLSISKYNLGATLDEAVTRKIQTRKAKSEDGVGNHSSTIILIPGQVEDDASILKGCVDIATNTDLIKTVRAACPEAFIIYKPHPDVISGNRHGNVDSRISAHYCDAVLEDVSITDCLALADEVHTLTSLVGMEALMHQCKVYCYGIPFYAGWGLTHDRHTVTRRTRSLSLPALIAATYIIYPRYIDWSTGELCTPERVIAQVSEQLQKQGGKAINKVSRVRRQLRKMINISKGFLRDLSS